MKTHSKWMAVVLLALLFLLAMPAGAQTEPGQSPEATAAGQSAGDSPVQSDAMTLALSLIEKVGYIIAFYLLFKSVPADKVRDALATAASDAEKTPPVWDDMAVKIGQVLADALMKAQGEQRTPKAGETIIETNVIHATGDREGEAAAQAMSTALKTAAR